MARLAARRPRRLRRHRSSEGAVQTGHVQADNLLRRTVRDRGDLVDRLARVLIVGEGRRSGDPETRVSIDHRLPDPGGGGDARRARWRLATSGSRLYPPPVPRAPLTAWHGADGAEGRRL